MDNIDELMYTVIEQQNEINDLLYSLMNPKFESKPNYKYISPHQYINFMYNRHKTLEDVKYGTFIELCDIYYETVRQIKDAVKST